MTNRKPDNVRASRGEDGSAIIVALILMALLMTASLAATSVRVAGARSADNHEAQQEEYWGARSGASAVEASLRADVPAAYDADVARAKLMAGGRSMPSFDSHDVAPSASRPLMRADGARSSFAAETCTSLLGNIDAWAAARWPVADEYARQLGYNAKVAMLREAYRPALTGGKPFSEPGYALEFYVDAAAGQFGRVRPSGLILLGPAYEGCNTTVTLDASPATITQGEAASLVVTYTNATSVVVKDQAGNVVFNQAVTDSGAAQSLNIPVAPAATTTYSATASTGTGCQADSAPRTLTVLIPPPEILAFDAAPACIILGSGSTLSWNIKGATSATIDGTPVNPVSGTMAVSPTATTSYTLVASNSSGSVQAQTTVQVTIPPKVNLFTADPACVVFGSDSVIRWNVADAASVTINGTPVDPSSGFITVAPNSETTYTLEATGAGCSPQKTQAQVTVSVATPPRINSFSAAPATLIKGSGLSSTLQWDVTGAVSATINGAPVNPAAGMMSVMPSATTVYKLVVTGGGCSPQTREAEVTVTVDEPAPLTCPVNNGFTATPSCILAGQTSQLQWSVSDADTVTLNGTPVALSGSLAVSPPVTTVYTLVASRDGCAPQQSQVTVEVTTPPTVNSFGGAPGSIQAGQSASLSWDVSDATSVTIDGVAVNPRSGTLTVTPGSTHTYTLVATGGGCSPQVRQATFTVNVTACPSINLFDATPGNIFPGGTSTLRWDVGGATSVTINGTPVPASGNMTVSPAATTAYRLVARSAGGGCDVEQTVTVNVSSCPAPQVSSFTANPTSVTAGGGQMVRLSWSVSDTSGAPVSVTISPGVGTFSSASGFVDISQPQATTTYTIVATNGCGASSPAAHATVTVNEEPCSLANFTNPLPASALVGPEVIYFSVFDDTDEFTWWNVTIPGIVMQTWADVHWRVANADNVTVNGVPVPLVSRPTRDCSNSVDANSCTRGDYTINFSDIAAVGVGNFYPVTIEAWHSSDPSRRTTMTQRIKYMGEFVNCDNFRSVVYGSQSKKTAAPGEVVRVNFSMAESGDPSPAPPGGPTTASLIDGDGNVIASNIQRNDANGNAHVDFAAPSATQKYKLRSDQPDGCGRVAETEWFYLAVDNGELMPGWSVYGKGGADSANQTPPVITHLRVLPGGAVQVSVGTNYIALPGMEPGYEPTFFTLLKDGVPFYSQKVRCVGGACGGRTYTIPASKVPNAGCGRIDVITMSHVSSGDFNNTRGYVLTDTRHPTGYSSPASPNPVWRYGSEPGGSAVGQEAHAVPDWDPSQWQAATTYVYNGGSVTWTWIW